MSNGRHSLSSLKLKFNRRRLKLAIIGSFDGTHIGGSLARAGARLGLETMCFDVADSMRGNRFLRIVSWRFANHRPLHLQRFSKNIVSACTSAARPEVLIATGSASINEHAVSTLRKNGIICINYATDDPGNPSHCARWHLQSLRAYDAVFTPRRNNIDDFIRLGC